eukprot:8167132-Ditylum_brightwellii.AAC.1
MFLAAIDIVHHHNIDYMESTGTIIPYKTSDKGVQALWKVHIWHTKDKLSVRKSAVITGIHPNILQKDLDYLLAVDWFKMFLTPPEAAACINDALCCQPKVITITNNGPKSSRLHMNPIPTHPLSLLHLWHINTGLECSLPNS